MQEREGPGFFESFQHLQRAQEALEQHGYFLYPVPKEHAEALVTGPLVHRLATTIKKRHFANVAGHVAITFSGYATDPREIYEIPEVRDFWRALDAQLPELPALLTALPAFGFNGPGQHLLLLGHVDAVVSYPAEGQYAAHVIEGPELIADALTRIRQAGHKYQLSDTAVSRLVAHFMRHAGAE